MYVNPRKEYEVVCIINVVVGSGWMDKGGGLQSPYETKDLNTLLRERWNIQSKEMEMKSVHDCRGTRETPIHIYTRSCIQI